AQMPPPGGFRGGAAQQPADGLLRPGPARPRRAGPRCGGLGGRRQSQHLGLHAGKQTRRQGDRETKRRDGTLLLVSLSPCLLVSLSSAGVSAGERLTAGTGRSGGRGTAREG